MNITSFSSALKSALSFTLVLMSAKSYGSGDTRCGGVLDGLNYTNVNRLSSFNLTALARCDNNYGPYNGYGFSGEQNTADLLFEFTPSTNNVANLYAACGAGGYSYLQINKILVR